MFCMNCLNLNHTLQIAYARLAYQLINLRIPELLSYKFDSEPPNYVGKPAGKPPNFGRTHVGKSQFRFQACRIYRQLPNWLTSINSPKLFKKWH